MRATRVAVLARTISFPKMRLVATAALLVFALSSHANEANRILLGMSDTQRLDTLSQFMARSGENCAATKAMYQGSTQSGDALWSIACRGGKDWSLLIFNDRTGSTKILDCKTLKAMKAGECWKRYK